MTLFAGFFDRRVAVAEAHISEDDVSFYPEESELIAGAVAQRRREFFSGRACARRALDQLGFSEAPLLSRSDRVPDWPDDVVGSITHDETYCACAVARRSDGVWSVGIDVEPREPLSEDLWATVLLPVERRWIDGQPSYERGVLAKALFSAKESVFKCQYGITNTMLEFDAIEIEIDAARQAFGAKLRVDAAPFVAGHAFNGRIRFADGKIASAVVFDAEQGA